MRVLLDTNELVRVVLGPNGPVARLLRDLLRDPSNTLVLSDFILDEVADVLGRPHILKRFRISSEQIRQYCDQLREVADPVDLRGNPPTVISDPKDRQILQTALDGGADVLCTRDAHFREPAVVEFARRNGIAIMGDLELLAILDARRP